MLIADAIEDPWYAAQAYACCARFAPDAEFGPLVAWSLERARAGRDDYQRLAAIAWPLRAMIECGRAVDAAREFEAIAGLAPSVSPAGSRAEACNLVFGALAVGPRDLALRAVHWLVGSLDSAGHWRERRAIRDAAIVAATLGLVSAGDAGSLAREPPLARRVMARLAAGERRLPRSFFESSPSRVG